MSIVETLKSVGLPFAYSHFTKNTKDPVVPPYIVFIGSGQNNAPADNTLYWRENTYQVEYYFKDKNESKEAEIEDALLENGYVFSKSEDIFIEEENVFVIYYYI